VTWVTKLGPEAEQVEYRLAEAAGCTAGLDSGQQPAAGDAQLRYHLDGSDHGLTWFGEGLRDIGLAPGTAMTEAGKDAARALMAGVDPRTGAVLRAPKMELDPRGKLAAAPLAEAMAKAAADRGAGGAQDLVAANAWAAARLARISRGLDRQGEAHEVPAGDLRKIAAAAGLGLAWPALRTTRVAAGRAGNRRSARAERRDFRRPSRRTASPVVAVGSAPSVPRRPLRRAAPPGPAPGHPDACR
jgi:hypothetical protein